MWYIFKQRVFFFSRTVPCIGLELKEEPRENDGGFGEANAASAALGSFGLPLSFVDKFRTSACWL